MNAFYVVCALLVVSTQAQGPNTPCAQQGGTCVPRNSKCCPARMNVNDDLCNPTHRCCLPSQKTGVDPPPPISGPCDCSTKHEQTLAFANSEFMLGGSTTYDPFSQVPHGSINRNCIPRGPSCDAPEDVCLKNRVLNLLLCAPDACNGPQGIWKLHSILNSNTCVGSNCESFCDGNGVLFERVNHQCGFGQLKNMCEDTGGVYEKDGEYVWCRY